MRLRTPKSVARRSARWLLARGPLRISLPGFWMDAVTIARLVREVAILLLTWWKVRKLRVSYARDLADLKREHLALGYSNADAALEVTVLRSDFVSRLETALHRELYDD